MEYTQQDVESNLGLVFAMANEMYNRLCGGKGKVIEYQDLVSEGVIGLHLALRRFDPSRGFKLSSFAVATIRGCMLQGHRRLFTELWKAEASGITVRTISLFGGDEIEPILGVDDQGVGARGILERLDRRMFWDKIFKVLTRRQKEVVHLTLEGMTQIEISQFLGVTKQAVHITYHNAVGRAKTVLSEGDDAFEEAA